MRLEPGDIFACYGPDWISRAISLQTSSPFGPRRLRWAPCHVAIALDVSGELLWCESTALCGHPCYLTGTHVRGCQAHEAYYRINDYRQAGGRVDVYRLTGINSLSGTEARLLGDVFRRHFIAKRVAYDFAGAAISGTRVWKWLPFVPANVLDTLFCSELIAALLMRVGRVRRCNPTVYSPGKLMRELVQTGVCEFKGAA